MGKRELHLCQSVSGALKNWRKAEWESVAKHNNATVREIKEQFKIYAFEGKLVIPLGPICEGFSYISGCQGHEIKGVSDE